MHAIRLADLIFGPLKSVEWNTLSVSDEDGNEIDAEDL